MKVRVLEARDGADAVSIAMVDAVRSDARWVWFDIEADSVDLDELLELTAELSLDAIAVHDAVCDSDLPKVDDFGSSILLVLHGLASDRIATSEIDCFLSERHLVTVRQEPSPSLDLLWTEVQTRTELSRGGPDELTARLADIVTRRLLSILDAFDERVDDLIAKALDADPDLVCEVTIVRSDLAVLRRAAAPQRETLDLLRHSTSPVVSAAARRRFSDVFDVASRATQGVDAARTALAETLDAYRGAEAHDATEVNKVLTMYAAIMFPLSLITGYFGMNFTNLPGIHSDDGWLIATGVMAAVAAVSFGVFVSVGWIRRPSSRDAGATLGHGLVEAARAPAEIVGAVVAASIMPLRTVAGSRRKSGPTNGSESPDTS